MLFDDVNLTDMEKAMKHADHRQASSSELYDAAEMCDDFYDSDIEGYIDKIGDETDEDYNERPKMFVNFTKPIADKRAGVYEGQATRSIDVGEKDIKDMLEALWEEAHTTFQEIDLQCELGAFCCVRVSYDEKTDTINISHINPRMFFL